MEKLKIVNKNNYVYTLETENIPKISKIFNFVAGGDNPFHCEVYFINKTEQMSIKWGTDSKVQYIEPTYGFPISIGESGEMSLRVEDARKLLIKLVGTEELLIQSKLVSFFKSFMITRVKTYIAQVMKSEAINIFEIDEKLTMFSDSIKALLLKDFEDYGVSLERFFVTNILKPDGDKQYETFKNLHFRQYADIAEAKLQQQTNIIYAQTEAQKTIIESQALATKRMQEGYTYQQERGFDVAEKVASNEAVGQFTNLGVGFGTMAGVGGAVGGMVGGMMNDAVGKVQTPVINTQGVQVSKKFCENCGHPISEGMAFCEECGTPVIQNNVCKTCGYVFERPSKFCPNCGTKREV